MKRFGNFAKLASAEIGNILAPMVLKLTSVLKDAMVWFSGLSDTTKKAIVIFAGVAAAIGPLILAFGFVAGAITNLMAIWPLLVTAFTFMKATLLPGLIVGLKTLFAVMLTNPIGIIITAIGLLVTAGVLLVKNWDVVSDFFLQMWGGLRELFSGNLGWILTAMFPFIGIPMKIIEHWDVLKGYFVNLWDTVKGPIQAMGKALGKFFGFSSNDVGATTGLSSANESASLSPKKLNRLRNNSNNVSTTNTEKASVTVDFKNLPKGTNVKQESTGKMGLSVNQGFNSLGLQ